MLDVRRDGAQLEIRGALDAEGGRRLLAEIARADGDVHVDGSGLERIDGAGLTALAVARHVCRAQERAFEVVPLPPDAASGLRAARVLPVLFSAPAPVVAERTTPASEAPAAVATRPGRRGRLRHRHRTAHEE